VTSARAAWALCAGADFINTARGFMFALGCIQALRCHNNTCPTGGDDPQQAVCSAVWSLKRNICASRITSKT
jgi:glutamate synthase domain-containing protein 2